MYPEVNRNARGMVLALLSAIAIGCHHHAANPTSLAPDMGIDAGPQPVAPLLTRGDKVLVVIDGEKRGTGTYNGDRVVLDPPLRMPPYSQTPKSRAPARARAAGLHGCDT